ncbi:hypothetical protein [Hymenobacter glaciei]
MKKLLLLLAATLSFFDAQADYEPTLLSELIETSDLIFYGEIVAIQKSTVTAKSVQRIKGVNPNSEVAIDKFENWTCATRFAPYKVGQKAFFFLKKRKSANHYFALGAANEGEIPAFNQKVYYQNQYLSIDKNPRLFKVYGGAVRGYVYDKNQFIEALKYYMKYRVENRADIIHHQARIDTIHNPVLLRIFAELQPPRF